MTKLILRNFQALGDIVMLTAALRDLHRACPGLYMTDVRTSCMELWENNPYITPLNELDPDVVIVNCEYPLIHCSNSTPNHFINGFVSFLSAYLNALIQTTEFRGDLHLSDLEKSWISQVHEIVSSDLPFWLIVAGGKFDFTIKWWETKRYQEIVDHYAGRILFVQVGEASHHHPALNNVIDLRGKTDIRQLVRLMYHAQGVVCPVTGLMHLAAAVEVKASKFDDSHLLPRPCVVIAGGREPSQWEAYPHHRFLHNIGTLACCGSGGCWRSRTFPIGDGDEKDGPDGLCLNTLGPLPLCMHLITAHHAISAIDSYLAGLCFRMLNEQEVLLLKGLGIWK